jgi:hypothetical protein
VGIVTGRKEILIGKIPAPPPMAQNMRKCAKTCRYRFEPHRAGYPNKSI